MKNKIDDLRNHLFAELERLGDEKLTGDALQAEIQRAKAIREVAGEIIQSAKAETDRLRLVDNAGVRGGTALLGHDERFASKEQSK